jgi:hypothetical protein
LVFALAVPIFRALDVPFWQIPILANLVGIAVRAIAIDVAPVVRRMPFVLAQIALIAADILVYLMNARVVLINLLSRRLRKHRRAGNRE